MKIRCNYQVNDFLQWLVVIGIFGGKYIELSILFTVLLMSIYHRKKVLVDSRIISFLSIICVISLLSITVNHYSYSKFIQQFLSISVFCTLYSSFFVINRNNISSIFDKYLTIAYWVAILGLLQFLLFFLTGTDILFYIGRVSVEEVLPRIIRIRSIVDEPSYLSTLLTPALAYYFLSDRYGIKVNCWRKYATYLTVLLTFSTVTYLVFILIVFYKYAFLHRVKYIVSFCLFSCLLFIVFSFFIPSTQKDVNMKSENAFSSVFTKISDTYTAFVSMDPMTFETLNLSTYSTMTNIFVALNAPSRIIGTGLGTHTENYTTVYTSDYKYYGLNKDDGYSLFNRIYSEFGLVGLFILSLFIFKFKNNKSIINISILFILITLSIRGGNYIKYGTVFFFFMYYYSFKNSDLKKY